MRMMNASLCVSVPLLFFGFGILAQMALNGARVAFGILMTFIVGMVTARTMVTLSGLGREHKPEQ